MPFEYYKDMEEDKVKERASRYNTGKLAWHLVDFKALESMVEVLMFGAQKYSPDNWKKGMPYSEIMDSLLRHLIAFKTGENIDLESQKKHVGHILCNAMFLAYMTEFKPEFDDRLPEILKQDF